MKSAAQSDDDLRHAEEVEDSLIEEADRIRQDESSAAYTVLESIRDLADYESESDDGHWAVRKLEAIWALADDALVNREDESRV